ncbi:MAG: DUF6448 family protein [Sphingobacteriales bacterium]
MKNLILSFLFLTGLLISSQTSFAHCDTKDGPVVAAAQKAIEQNNINYVLIWVHPADEKEIKKTFGLTMKVREFSPEAKTLADNYFFETVVRPHRSGEGIPYTGVKPSGTPIDGKILAADKSIAVGNLTPLNDLVPKDRFAELKKRFEKVMSLKNYDVNNVGAGREYVEAYVQFFHFAEGEGEHNLSHIEEGRHLEHLPWLLSGILLITSVSFAILYYRKK